MPWRLRTRSQIVRVAHRGYLAVVFCPVDDAPLAVDCLPLPEPLDVADTPAGSLSADLVSAFLPEEELESPSESLFDPLRLSVR